MNTLPKLQRRPGEVQAPAPRLSPFVPAAPVAQPAPRSAASGKVLVEVTVKDVSDGERNRYHGERFECDRAVATFLEGRKQVRFVNGS